MMGSFALFQPQPHATLGGGTTIHRSTNDKEQEASTSRKRHGQSPIGSSRNPAMVEEIDSDVEIVGVKRAGNI